tara:strand:- start:5951 stop:9589 length:3639 start_codon:yes stop_codon:yes gene_type:complete
MKEISNIKSEPVLNLPNVSSKDISKSFNPEDNIELHIFDLQGKNLESVSKFKSYILTTSSIRIEPREVLRARGYAYGQYKLHFFLQRIKIFQTKNEENPFTVLEISPSRTEIRLISPKIKNGLFRTSIKTFISEIENSAYFKDFVLNFGEGINITGINALLNTNTNKYELLIKTLDPLPSSINKNDTCKIAESIIDPVSFEVDMGNPTPVDDTVPLRGPNFNIPVREQKSIPSNYKNYDQLLKYNVSSSYNSLVNILEKQEIPKVQYDYIRPVSESLEETHTPYHFENFVHFSNATERLKNFKHKLILIEDKNKKIGNIDSIGTTLSNASSNNRINLNKEIDKITKGFDGYERFLYYTTGSNLYTWPKQTEIISPGKPPYIPYSISSSEAKIWLGHEADTAPHYGGQLLSSSLYDRQNVYKLVDTLPIHIKDGNSNSFYVNLINMMGQHFDQIWTHIKHITKIKDTHHKRGISKDLVYLTLQNLGIDVYDQFENTDLSEYLLGEGTGSNQYDVKHYLAKSGSSVPTETMVTASNEGSIPKGDIAKEVWKRIYHNVPYLLKTKGTERGLRAIMNCYGIPSTTLNVKEYGGSVRDKTGYKTFSYEKAGLALKGSSKTTTGIGGGSTGHFIKTDWSASINSNDYNEKTVTFRIKPTRIDQSTNYHLFTLSGSTNAAGTHIGERDNHLILEPWGSINTDISSSGDHNQYGRLSYYQGNTLKESTSYFPIFNGDFWNVFVKAENIGGNQTEGSASFGAYQANSLKNVAYYTAETTNIKQAKNTWGWSGNDRGAREAFFGGVPTNESSDYDTVGGLMYSGSMQEIRYYFGEALSHDTLKKQALEPYMYAGNSISSSYDHLILRLPLGSSLHKNTSSFHPNIDVDYINSGSISSSLADPVWENISEIHHLPTPDTVGASMSSEKIRIDTGTIDDNILSHNTSAETSTLDRQPPDYEDLGIFLSPTSELNEDIIYTLGAFKLDDYIGSPLPSSQTSSYYSDLKELRDLYFKKIKRRYNYWDYLKTIEYIDHTLFKVIEQFVPFRANTKTGLLIEPHYLERNKFQRQIPVQTYGQTAVLGSYNTFHIDLATFSGSEDKYKGSSIISIDTSIGGGNTPTHNTFTTHHIGTDKNGYRTEFGTNATINLYDWAPNIQEAAQAPIKPFGGIEFDGASNYRHVKPKDYKKYNSNVLMGNVQKGRTSTKYYRSLAIGNQNDILNNNN